MKKSRLIVSSLLISSLLALQVMADTASAPVITAGGSHTEKTAALSTVTSVPSTVYQPGTYQTGTDLPAGEYVLLVQASESAGYYSILTDSSADAEAVDYSTFDYNAIIRIEDGQQLQLRGCTASPIGEVPQIDHYYGTMYKVGYHIPAGTYRLKCTDMTTYGVAYILSCPSDNYDAVVDYVYVGDTAAVTVSEGQYLQLIDCVVTQTTTAAEVSADHGMPASTWESSVREALLTGDAQRTSPIITAGTLIPGLPVTTSTPATVYSGDSLQAGVDLPAGEYVLFGGEDTVSLYAVTTTPSPETGEEILEYGSFQYNAIIRLEEGQYLTMSGCTASPMEEITSIDYRKGDHFKVGYHIPAGTYQFKSNSAYAIAYILSAPTRRSEDLVDYQLIYGKDSIVTMAVEEGQYLLLTNCSFTSGGSSQEGPGGSGSSTWDSAMEGYMDYLKQILGYEEEESASPVVTAPRKSSSLPDTTTTPSTVYPEGSYQAGTDIPAGEYMLLSTQDNDSQYFDSGSSTYLISTLENAESYDDIVDYNFFTYNAIIRLEEGQYLYLNGCTASPVDEVTQLDYRKAEMYKAGLHIPAGTYGLKASAEGYGSFGRCYVLAWPSDSYDAVVESIAVPEEGAQVTVENGQYLQLKRCTLTDSYEGDSSRSGPAFAQPQRTDAETEAAANDESAEY